MEQFETWVKVNGRNRTEDPISEVERYAYFEKQLWFDFGNNMWSKQRSIFQDNVKYIQNEILNPFRASILQYTERIREMNGLTKYLSISRMEGDQYNKSDWAV